MRDRSIRRAAFIIWAVFAFVTWNVVFDRHVYVASMRFTQDQIEKFQAGQPINSIETGFRPHVRQAAWEASAWGGSVLAIGVLLSVAGRRRRN
jgi:hypothetical protein